LPGENVLAVGPLRATLYTPLESCIKINGEDEPIGTNESGENEYMPFTADK